MTPTPEREEALHGLRNLERGYSLSYAVDWYAREKGLNVLDMIDALAADLEAAEREVKRQEDEKWAAENRADEAERDRDEFIASGEIELRKRQAAERELKRIRSVPSHQRTLQVLAERERADTAERERDELRGDMAMTWEQTWKRLRKVERDLATAREALRQIANQTYPATYLGKREDGTEIYGGTDDAARFARAALLSLEEKA